MKHLNPNWITEGWIDFEYKKYLLLDYLQEVNRQFGQKKLYPTLSEIISHFQNLRQLKEQKAIVSQSFPKAISKIDFENFVLKYQRLIAEEKCMEELETIMDFAIPQFQNRMESGRELYASVENDLEIFPVGIVPVNPELGYLFLSGRESRQTKIYEYQITLFENSEEKFRGIKMEYICTSTRSLMNTYENIKCDLLKGKQKVSTPGTFVIESHHEFPLRETLLPVAKRTLVRYLYNLNR